MKLTEFKKLIREEVRKVLNEGLETATVEVYGLKPGSQQQMPYSDFLSLLQTGKIKREVRIVLYDSVAKQPLTGPLFKDIQKDLFAIGYKWIDGTQKVVRTSGDGNRTMVGINPIKKQLDISRV